LGPKSTALRLESGELAYCGESVLPLAFLRTHQALSTENLLTERVGLLVLLEESIRLLVSRAMRLGPERSRSSWEQFAVQVHCNLPIIPGF
jgi:hypothetical protein